MFKYRSIASAFLILFLFSGGGQAKELSFNQALEMLKSSNNELLAAQAEERQASYKKDAASGLYFPSVDFEGRYTRIDEPIELDLNDIRTVMIKLFAAVDGVNVSSSVPDFKMTVQEETFYKSNVNFTWPIYTGGKISAINNAANAKIIESKENTRRVNATLISELVKRYYGVRLAKDVVEVRQQVLESMEEHLKHAKRMQESGMIALSEKLHAEVTWSEAEREFKKAVRTLQITQAALNSLLASSEEIVPVSAMFILNSIEPLDSFQEHAESSNPTLNQIAMKRKQADDAYDIEKSDFYPTVYLFGKRELHTEDLTALEPEWAVGIGFRYNLFSGFSSRSNMKAAQQLQAQLGFLEHDAQIKINTLVEKRYNELMLSLEQFEATKTSLKFADEYVRVRNKAFTAGMTTSIDVVDAQLALSRVKIERLNAAYQFDVALAQLLEASGNSEQFETYRNHNNSQEL